MNLVKKVFSTKTDNSIVTSGGVTIRFHINDSNRASEVSVPVPAKLDRKSFERVLKLVEENEKESLGEVD